ncbi:rhomboid family intramembrane serine protease [Haloferula sp. BvORR071]|uniref:rhomboid family intramembrane serine protease n=1 Tax=Haloferula sp. BvORR071 TaxID=1396141 RepID=UPI00055548DA|nr:rhomboid family intramembrane serine protease [Haloferula sp. BvORR071]
MERWRRLGADIRAAKLTMGLAASLCVVQIILSLLGQPDWIYETFGLSRDGIRAGRIWELLTHAFIHGPWPMMWWHLALNALALLVAGARLERIADAAVLLKVFLAGVLAGGLVQLAVTPNPEKLLVGASGGIFAVVLWLVTVSPSERMWPIPVSARNLGIGLMLAEAGLLVTAWCLPDSGLAIVGNGCHLGGGIIGWWLARKKLGPMLTREDLLKERAKRESA